MSETQKKALEKLGGEPEKLSPKANAVKAAVIEQMKAFCRMNDEFAQAVAQSDKTISECIEYTVRDCGNSISDIEVYKRAAAFWFSGAEVKCTITIDLGDGGISNQGEAASGSKPEHTLKLNLDDLL